MVQHPIQCHLRALPAENGHNGCDRVNGRGHQFTPKLLGCNGHHGGNLELLALPLTRLRKGSPTPCLLPLESRGPSLFKRPLLFGLRVVLKGRAAAWRSHACPCALCCGVRAPWALCTVVGMSVACPVGIPSGCIRVNTRSIQCQGGIGKGLWWFRSGGGTKRESNPGARRSHRNLYRDPPGYRTQPDSECRRCPDTFVCHTAASGITSTAVPHSGAILHGMSVQGNKCRRHWPTPASGLPT